MKREIPELDLLTHYDSWLLVGRVHVKCHQLLTSGLHDLGLSVAKYDVLHAIYREEGMSQQRLARRLLVAKSNITVLTQRLEAEDLLRRERDPNDGRGHCVFLTRAGRSLVRRAVRFHAEVVALMADGLTDKEAQVLHEIMGRTEKNLDQALTARG